MKGSTTSPFRAELEELDCRNAEGPRGSSRNEMKAKKGSPSSPSVNDDSWVKRSLE